MLYYQWVINSMMESRLLIVPGGMVLACSAKNMASSLFLVSCTYVINIKRSMPRVSQNTFVASQADRHADP